MTAPQSPVVAPCACAPKCANEAKRTEHSPYMDGYCDECTSFRCDVTFDVHPQSPAVADASIAAGVSEPLLGRQDAAGDVPSGSAEPVTGATSPAALTPCRFATYGGDCRESVGQVMGPNTLGELLTVVSAAYDQTANTTRLGFVYGAHDLTTT